MKTKNTIQKLFVAIAILLLFLPIYKAFGQNEEDFNDIGRAKNNAFNKFWDYGNAVCRITSPTAYSTGVLLNNTNNDSKMYVLTNAHILPGFNEESEELTMDIPSMNAGLSRYVFDFQFQKDVGVFSSSGSLFKGAKIASLYYKNIDLSTNENYYLTPTDLVLLELLERPNLTDGFIPYYAGWDFDYEWPEGDNCILIHHPDGFYKKISMVSTPQLADQWWMKEYNSTTKVFDETSNYSFDYSTDENINDFPKDFPEPDNNYLIGHDLWRDMFNDGKLGIPIAGSSGSPYFNTMGNVIAIHQISTSFVGDINSSKFIERLNFDKFEENPNYDDSIEEYSSFTRYLNPTLEDITQLNGCYPCAAGTRGLTLNEQNRYLKTLDISEEISGDKAQDFVAQDEIKVSSTIRSGARISFAAEQVLLGQDTNFEQGSEVEITSGGKNGLSCATGCYSIIVPPNPEYFFSNGSYYAKGIENAKNYTVQIKLSNGEMLPSLPEMPVHGSNVKLFELLDLNREAAAVKNTTATVKATFTNDCDTPREVTFQITFDDSISDNAFLSDYYHYKEDPVHGSKMPSIETYMANKKALTKWYQPAASFDPTTAQHPEDVLFEIEVEKDITYATASGYEWSFRGGKGYRAIGEAFTSGNGESVAHLDQEFEEPFRKYRFLKDKPLKMDIYYPKYKVFPATRAGRTLKRQTPALPVICYVFGGGFITHDQPELGDEICRWFAQKGYIVAFIDYRIGADLTNKDVSKRAPMRAWQDVNAAVQFLRKKGIDHRNAKAAATAKWKIDPNKIYGNGWSAGAITCLHNVTLNKKQYLTEREINKTKTPGFLVATKKNYLYKSLKITYYTYDLEDYPTKPCKLGETGENSPCTGLNTDSQFNAVGVFSGAIGREEWLNNLQRPAIDIHHHDDEIVLWDDGVPFKKYAPITNFLSLTQVPPLYGGGYLKETYPNKTQFDVVTLTEETQAGGKPKGLPGLSYLGTHHASMIKWGDRAGVNHPPRLENKEMFLLDGFFMNQSIAATKRLAANANKEIEFQHLYLYPNPSKGSFKLDFNMKAKGLVSFKIVNIIGQQLFEQKNIAFDKGNNSFDFDLTNKLPAGIYFLKVDSNEFSESLKIVIE